MRRDTTNKQAEHKGKYRVKNWTQCNAGLIAQGDVTMWIGLVPFAAASETRGARPGPPMRLCGCARADAARTQAGLSSAAAHCKASLRVCANLPVRAELHDVESSRADPHHACFFPTSLSDPIIDRTPIEFHRSMRPAFDRYSSCRLRVINAQGIAVQVDHSCDNTETKARTRKMLSVLRPIKALKHRAVLSRRDANAGIRNLNTRAGGSPDKGYPNFATSWCELDRVVHKVAYLAWRRGSTPERQRLTDAQLLTLIRTIRAEVQAAYGLSPTDQQLL